MFEEAWSVSPTPPLLASPALLAVVDQPHGTPPSVCVPDGFRGTIEQGILPYI